MTRLNKIVLRSLIQPDEIVSKKTQKYILGGYGGGGLYTVCCRYPDSTPGCWKDIYNSPCEGNLCDGGNYNCK